MALLNEDLETSERSDREQSKHKFQSCGAYASAKVVLFLNCVDKLRYICWEIMYLAVGQKLLHLLREYNVVR